MDTWRNMLRDMSVLDEICPSFITRDVSLGLLVKYDCKIVWLCRTKSIWDIRLIRYSLYFGIKKYKYLSIQRVTKSMPCDQYRRG